MRLIDADKLKEYIIAQRERIFKGYTIEGVMKMLVDEQPTVYQWIPVSERLPGDDRDVLVQMEDESVMVDCRAASSSGWFWSDCEDLPVAWTELPEPYKGE